VTSLHRSHACRCFSRARACAIAFAILSVRGPESVHELPEPQRAFRQSGPGPTPRLSFGQRATNSTLPAAVLFAIMNHKTAIRHRGQTGSQTARFGSVESDGRLGLEVQGTEGSPAGDSTGYHAEQPEQHKKRVNSCRKCVRRCNPRLNVRVVSLSSGTFAMAATIPL
jgi:hypothetical protein